MVSGVENSMSGEEIDERSKIIDEGGELGSRMVVVETPRQGRELQKINEVS